MLNYHTHTEFSMLDGFGTTQNFAKTAVELGQKAIGVSEHGNMLSALSLQQSCKEHNIKPIFGCEYYFVDDVQIKQRSEKRHHMIMIAKNNDGFQQMQALCSFANIKGFYYRPRIDVESILNIVDLKNVILTTACPGSWINSPNIGQITQKLLENSADIFVEIQPHDNDVHQSFNTKAYNYACKWDLDLIAGVDAHCPSIKDVYSQDVLMAVQMRKTIDDPSLMLLPRAKNKDHHTYFLYSEKQFFEMNPGNIPYDEIVTAVGNTDWVADQCDVKIENKKIMLPMPPKMEKLNMSDEDILWDLCIQGFKQKLNMDIVSAENDDTYFIGFPEEEQRYEKYLDRLNEEFDLLSSKGFCTYFLIVDDLLKWCRGEDIPVGPGRGCYTGGAMVWTTDGYKKIKDVSVGDRVINEDGEIDTVLNKFEYNIQESVYEIDYVYGSNTFSKKKCTGDHKQLSHKDGVVDWVETKNLDSSMDMCIPKMKPLNKKIKTVDLNAYNEGGYLFDDKYIYEKAKVNKPYHLSQRSVCKEHGISRNCLRDYMRGETTVRKKTIKKIESITKMSRDEYIQYIHKNSFITKKVKRFLEIDDEFNVLVGLMVGDGCIAPKKRGLSLAINNETNKDAVNRGVFKRFYRKMVMSGNAYYENRSKTKKLSQLYIYSKVIANYFSEKVLLYDKEKFKYFDRGWLEQDKSSIESVFFGLLQSDGHYSKENRICFDNTSISVISSFCELALRLGYIPRILTRKPSLSGGYLCKKSYKVTIREFDKSRDGNEKYYFAPINSIKKNRPRKRKVYDLSIKNKQSFMINNYITHNSAGGSLIAFLLNITHLDPIEYNLIFARFLNEQRNDFPDIDMDFGQKRRQQVIKYVVDNYGQDKTGFIVTLSKMKTKAAVRDISRAYGVPLKQVDDFAKSCFSYEGDDLEEGLDSAYGRLFLAKYPHVVDFIKKIRGTIRGTSVHASGIIVNKTNLLDGSQCSVLRDKGKSDKRICGVVMDNCEDMGLMKLDILGLATLDVLHHCKKISGVNFEDIPLDDTKVFQAISSGKTLGAFQIEAMASTKVVKQIKPKNFDEVVACIALVRPGPMDSGMTDLYIERKNGAEWSSPHPAYEEITKSTFGILCYQEQVMECFVKLAGMPFSKADKIRKIIGKKRDAEAFEPYWKEFKQGCLEQNTLSPDQAKEFWDGLLKWASYGFNLSHSASYALITYWCMWYKINYPDVFYASALSFASWDEKKKDISKNRLTMLEEACLAGYKVFTPKYGQSEGHVWVCKQNTLFMPFSCINSVEKKADQYAKKQAPKSSMVSIFDEEEVAMIEAGTKAEELLVEMMCHDPEKLPSLQNQKKHLPFNLPFQPDLQISNK